ncbi:hypothetical protein ACLKA6_013396 [Drosophila palustris]
MSNLEPCDSGNGSNSNMANDEQQQQMPQSCPTGETVTVENKSARSGSGSGRSIRESGSGSGSVIDHLTDHSSLRATRSRPLARLDRLLRRWLPGYNYLRGAFANNGSSSSSGSGSSGSTGSTHIDNRPETVEPLRPSLAVSRSGSGSVSSSVRTQRSAICVEPTLPVRKRKDGEVVLDTGIAKSEFCMKLEKLLRAKLIVKD